MPPRILRSVFAIDPGVSGVGFALLNKVGPKSFRLVHAANIYPPKGASDFQDRAWHIIDDLSPWMHNHKETHYFVCEFPTFMHGKAVASLSDATLKMAYMVGVIVQEIQPYATHGIKLVTPNQWKGTMSKALIERRCRKHVTFDAKSHAVDAIGIGLKFLGAW